MPKLIDCKFAFESNQVKFTESTNFFIYLRSNSDVPIKIGKIIVTLTSNNGINQKLEATTGHPYEFEMSTKTEKLGNSFNAKDFILDNGKCFKFEIEMKPGVFIENSEITVSAVELFMGTHKLSAVLKMQKSLNYAKPFYTYNTQADHLEFVKIIRTCYIIPT